MLLVLSLATLVTSIGYASLPRRTPVQPPTPANDYTREQLDAIPTPPNERYYIIVFGSQSTPKIPRLTHTWATIIKATWNAGQPEPALTEYTISWMPATLHIRTFSLRTEPGVNLRMHESIEIMQGKGQRVSMWGPYEVRPRGYLRFLIQKEFMESGRVGYQCVDKRGEAGKCGAGCDCIHAITDMDPEFDRTRYPLRWYGDAGSEHIVQQIASRGLTVHGMQVEEWLVPRLGLDCAGIVRRTYAGPVNDMVR
jgi:hypothetical protein